ncbi:FAD/NAD-P-binding domain-containing protein [Pterulicium gracile]|uniref:FAD/NAD-P-binding domain-containing protein n=1 Tax=Pterulicium gracile TaxID=1884261 RepID=A0A5C3QCD9_9AGAR|nr:FAD/NAD-P-binding domain-containing protein [Pterula gracilis]
MQSTAFKTVVVLGCAYGGARATSQLASTLPAGWKLVVIDRNTHVNHVYVLPRLLVLPGNEPKGFVPYTGIFNHGGFSKGPADTLSLHAIVTSLTPTSVTLDKSFPEHRYPDGVINFDYCVYALGSQLPDPVNLWGRSLESVTPIKTEQEQEEVAPQLVKEVYNGTKKQSLAWMERTRIRIEEAQSILVVGGGALGVQMSSDIAELHPDKKITLLHSRDKLLNRFDEEVHTQALLSLDALNVTTILGERLATWPDESCKGTFRTSKGTEVTVDLILMCTGQKPNTQLLTTMDPRTVDPKTGMAKVKRTMQLARLPSAPPPSISPLESAHQMAGAAPVDSVAEQFAGLAVNRTQVEIEARKEEDTVGEEEDAAYPHIFVVGDAADAFGALKAGHTAYWQADTACKNIIKLIKAGEPAEPAPAVVVADLVDDDTSSIDGDSQCGDDSDLDSEDEESKVTEEDDGKLLEYAPGPPAIKVTLGIKHSVHQVNGEIGTKDDGTEDCGAGLIWPYFGFKIETEADYLK